MSNDYNNSSNYNLYGLSASFLESLGISGPLHNKVFVANVSILLFKTPIILCIVFKWTGLELKQNYKQRKVNYFHFKLYYFNVGASVSYL